MSARPSRALTCVQCEAEMDACACCDEAGCEVALCYACVHRLVGQAPPLLEEGDS